MEILIELLQNRVLLSAFFGWLTAQVIKILIAVRRNGGFSLRLLAASGGMPSTHSATVTALAVSSGLTNGWNSTEFAIAFFLAMIVMYDAMGVRYETGLQAKVLNKMREKDIEAGREPLYEKPMDEKMGHTFPQIAAGFGIGILVAMLICLVIF